MDDLIAEQIAYYRARAPWYDDFWYRRGFYANRANDRWQRDMDALLAALHAWVTSARPRRVLELAAGTGEITRRIAPHVQHVTAVDSAPETLEINREKLRDVDTPVEYVVADLFAWEPPARYDAVVFGFWLSHVPRVRWNAFWSLVERSLVPGGIAWFCDSAAPDLAWEKGVLPRPENTDVLTGDGTIDRHADVHVRELPDGRTFRAVKRFFFAEDLERDLRLLGWNADVHTTEWAFIHGTATRA
jgi:demethylmenaquinone methyltransferase/2-methoxy-6-polyprenyl-1,4-benzoquinol methylase